MTPLVWFNEAGAWYWEALSDEDWIKARRLLDRFLIQGRPPLLSDPSGYVLRDAPIAFYMAEHPTEDAFVIYWVGNENE